MHRYNAVKSIFRELHSDYYISTDYWGPLRSRISYVLSHSGKAEDLDAILDKVADDKKENYKQKIDGIKKFWKKQTFKKIVLSRKVWKHKKLSINISPELSYVCKDKTFVIKLFFSSTGKTISKNEADMLLEIMKDAFDLNPSEVTIGILDVSRGKLFKYSKHSEALLSLVLVEAEGLCKTLEDLEKTN